jgi:hypothetical protein
MSQEQAKFIVLSVDIIVNILTDDPDKYEVKVWIEGEFVTFCFRFRKSDDPDDNAYYPDEFDIDRLCCIDRDAYDVVLVSLLILTKTNQNLLFTTEKTAKERSL